MKKLAIAFLFLTAPQAFADYKLNGNEANSLFALLRLSGAPVQTIGTNQKIMVASLVAWAGLKNDGTPFKICSFRANGSHTVPAGSVVEFMNLLRLSGLPARIDGANTIYRANSVTCMNFNFNGHVPSVSCAIVP